MKKIKIGLVGCGRISKKHLEAIKAHQNKFSLVAVCDNDPSKLENIEFNETFNKYISLDEMLHHEEIDVMSICTPSGYHSEHTIKCARKNVNVITEKPMATTYDDAINMINECKENNVKLFVVKQNRYNKTLVELQNAVKNNRFGSIKLVTINVFWHRNQKYYDQAKWRGTLKLDGGALMNQASHYVDLFTWLFGSVKSISSFSSTSLNIEAEDTIVINLKFNNGIIGTMNVSMLAYEKNFEGSITIIGEKGLVRVGGLAVNKVENWIFKEPIPSDKKITDVNYDIENIYGNGHTKFYEEAYKAIKGDGVNISRGEDGLKSLKVILAAYESSRTHMTINLD